MSSTKEEIVSFQRELERFRSQYAIRVAPIASPEISMMRCDLRTLSTKEELASMPFKELLQLFETATQEGKFSNDSEPSQSLSDSDYKEEFEQEFGENVIEKLEEERKALLNEVEQRAGADLRKRLSEFIDYAKSVYSRPHSFADTSLEEETAPYLEERHAFRKTPRQITQEVKVSTVDAVKEKRSFLREQISTDRPLENAEQVFSDSETGIHSSDPLETRKPLSNPSSEEEGFSVVRKEEYQSVSSAPLIDTPFSSQHSDLSARRRGTQSLNCSSSQNSQKSSLSSSLKKSAVCSDCMKRTALIELEKCDHVFCYSCWKKYDDRKYTDLIHDDKGPNCYMC